MIRGAGCGSPARPDLWEAGESDLPGPPDIPLQSLPLAGWIVLSFVLLFAVQAVVAVRPAGVFAQNLYARFYGGLFLDEWFTRLTLRVWPIRRSSESVPSVVRTHEGRNQ